jgi:hypothetical protein
VEILPPRTPDCDFSHSAEIKVFRKRFQALPAELRIVIYDMLLEDGGPELSAAIDINHNAAVLQGKRVRSIAAIVPAPFKRDHNQDFLGRELPRTVGDVFGFFPYVNIYNNGVSSSAATAGGKSMKGKVLGDELLWELVDRWVESNDVRIEGVFRLDGGYAGGKSQSKQHGNVQQSIKRLLDIAERDQKQDGERSLWLWLTRMRKCQVVLHLHGEVLCHLLRVNEEERHEGSYYDGTVQELNKAQGRIPQKQAKKVLQDCMAACAILLSKAERLDNFQFRLDLNLPWGGFPGIELDQPKIIEITKPLWGTRGFDLVRVSPGVKGSKFNPALFLASVRLTIH